MFILKKITDLKSYKYIYSSEHYLYAVSVNIIDILLPCLKYIDTININDLIIDTVFDQSLFILTPSCLIKITGNTVKNSYLDCVFSTLLSCKKKLFLCTSGSISVYKYDMILEYTLQINYNCICASDRYIYTLNNDLVEVYEYFDCLLIKKKIEINLYFLQTNFIEKDNLVTNLVYHNGKLYKIQGIKNYFVYINSLYIVDIYQDTYLVQEGNMYKTYDNIEHISNCGKYFIKNEHVKQNLKDLINFTCINKEILKIDNLLGHMIYIEETNEIIGKYLNKFYKIVKNRNLQNFKNIKLLNKITPSCLHACCLDTNEISGIEKYSDVLKIGEGFIFCRNLQNFILYDKFIILINEEYLFRYQIINSTIKYLGRCGYDKILGLYKEFVYFTLKNKYFISSIETGTLYDFIKKDVLGIQKFNNNIIIYEEYMIRIYKIQDKKYLKINIDEQSSSTKLFILKHKSNNLITSEFNTKCLQNINHLEDCINHQFVNKLFYANIKHKGIHVYSGTNLLKRDYIDRDIKSFFVHKDKIYLNDILNYVTVLNLEFDILGVIYIHEYICDWFTKKDKIYAISTNGNVYKIYEEEDTDINNLEYYRNHTRINFEVIL